MEKRNVDSLLSGIEGDDVEPITNNINNGVIKSVLTSVSDYIKSLPKQSIRKRTKQVSYPS